MKPAYAKMVRSRKQVSRSTGGNSNVRGGRGAKGGGTPRFTYDKKRGVYIHINNKVARYSDLYKGVLQK